MNFSGNNTTGPSPEAARQERLKKAILRNRAKRARKAKSEFQSSPLAQEEKRAWSGPLENAYNLPEVQPKEQPKSQRPSLNFHFKFPKIKIPQMSLSLHGKFTKLLAIFCLFLVYRLVFSDNGILDYYKMEDLLNFKKKELGQTHKNIKNLNKEIHLLRYNKYLGIIS